MNKYLLLRDNKQSGPYLAADLIAKGIKPYDLVWVEGKSAAWRYPSEVEELKAHAPAVEEQPFDRFYKKPEATISESSAPANARFAPVVKDKPIADQPAVPSRKVYINFPGGARQPVVVPNKIERPAPVAAELPVVEKESPVVEYTKPSDPVAAELSVIEKESPVVEYTKPSDPVAAAALSDWSTDNEALGTQPSLSKSSDNRLLYTAIAACFVLLVIISFLITNYGNQRSSIRQLNDMVAQMEKKQHQQSQSPQAALASRVITPPPAELLKQNVNASSHTTSTPTQQSVVTRPAVVTSSPSPVKTTNNASADPSVSKEVKPAPVAATARTGATVKENTTTKENNKTPDLTSENLFKLVSIKSNNYHTGLLGGISNLQFVLSNNSPRELQQVAVEVKYLSPEKKVIKTQTVYFRNVAPGAQPVLDVPKSSRGVSIDYTITNIKS